VGTLVRYVPRLLAVLPDAPAVAHSKKRDEAKRAKNVDARFCKRGPEYNDPCIHIVERSEFLFMGYAIRFASRIGGTLSTLI
jgi:hypothetical protein